MKSSIFFLIIGLILIGSNTVIAKNWKIAEDWKIVYWEGKRNDRNGINVVKVSVDFIGRGNSGILEDVELCGYDIKSDYYACRQIDYGRVYKKRPITF